MHTSAFSPIRRMGSLFTSIYQTPVMLEYNGHIDLDAFDVNNIMYSRSIDGSGHSDRLTTHMSELFPSRVKEMVKSDFLR